MIISEVDYLAHYGTPRHSGRYPWGSGGDNISHPDFQLPRNMTYNQHVNHLRKKGLKDTEIAEGFGITTTQLRARMGIAKKIDRQADIARATRLAEAGNSNTEIGKIMGRNESSIRAMLAPGEKEKADILEATGKVLRDRVADKKIVDVGKGTEAQLGVSKTRLDNTVAMLKEEGYAVHTVPIYQQGTGHDTPTKVLCLPGTTQKDAFLMRNSIEMPTDWSNDGGRTYEKPKPPVSISPKRVDVIWGPDGGANSDGVIYVRPGVQDLYMGSAKYAQVRIKVGDGHYMKGMAMYKDGLPDGVDLVFNTNKKDTGNKLDALKKIEPTADEFNPFGAITKQKKLLDAHGKETEKISALNIVNEEGDWGEWSKNLSSQMLSKQNPRLAKAQLDLAYDSKKNEYEEISALTNPTVKRDLLMKLADSADSSSVHLKAANLPGQRIHAILPLPSIKPSEVYAPNYENGTNVVLIRHPHSGPFEIPKLVVNNNNREAKRSFKNAQDAIGIHPDVAKVLSGADFDGDTVLVIPNTSRKIVSHPVLEGLKDFDSRSSYPGYDGMKVMKNTQMEMGSISNLITDMTIRNASQDEIARAVRHSMVVIDAEKHELNYKQSYLDNGIKDLKEKYQFEPAGTRGASTLISKAKAKTYVPEQKPRKQSQGGPIDKTTGELVFTPTNRINKETGKSRQTKVKGLAGVSDAHLLSSGTPIERIYADHSNQLKALANQARLEAIKTPRSKYNSSSAKVYAPEVARLTAALKKAEANAPLERKAQAIAASTIKAKRDANPDMDKTTLKKVKYQSLEDARQRMGAKKDVIEISPKEWEAIQAGAISSNKLEGILRHADLDVVRELATPRTHLLMSSDKMAMAKQKLALGYTRAEVADQLGVSISTLDRSFNDEAKT